MYEDLIKRLRELQAITEHCDEQSCVECENRKLCDKHDNKTLSGTYKEAADAIEQLSNAGSAYGRGWTLGYDAGREESKPRWIPVTERLPEYDSVVLVTDGEDVGTGYRYVLGEIGFKGWAVPFADIEDDDVSHWMPLPEPPKEVNKHDSD